MNHQPDRTLCTATRRDGMSCPHFALPGLTVCKVHGGNAAALYEQFSAEDLNRTPEQLLALIYHRTAGHLLGVRQHAVNCGVDTAEVDQQLRDALGGAA